MKLTRFFRHMWVMLAAASMPSCESPSLFQKHQAAAPASARPDYSRRRNSGRQTLQLEEIGTLHADRIEKVQGDEVKLSGQVFVKISNAENMILIGRLQFAYANEAVWNLISGELSLQGNCVVESTRAITKGTARKTRVIFSRDGRMTTVGPHETLLLD